MLIKIEAIVREEKMEDVKAALNEIQVNGFTVTQIMGCGTQRGYTEYVRGSKIDVFLKPKIKFEIVVSSEDWEIKVIDAVQKAAFTGDPGDGKIFSYEIRCPYPYRRDRIRCAAVGISVNCFSQADIRDPLHYLPDSVKIKSCMKKSFGKSRVYQQIGS